MQFKNISDTPLQTNIDKRGLKKLILLPDHSPGKGRIPVGTVAVYDQTHIPTAIMLGPDIGCGILLAKYTQPAKDIEHSTYKINEEIQAEKRGTHGLGNGNHFINWYNVEGTVNDTLQDGDTVIVIHSGSGRTGQEIALAKLKGEEYLKAYERASKVAQTNRKNILEIIQGQIPVPLTEVFDIPHNTLEVGNNTITYRKGAMHLMPNDIGILTSYIGGDGIIIAATPEIAELENSMSHGTGRLISRSEAKTMDFDSTTLRGNVYIPTQISDNDLRTEAPHCYRTLDQITKKIAQYTKSLATLKPISGIL